MEPAALNTPAFLAGAFQLANASRKSPPAQPPWPLENNRTVFSAQSHGDFVAGQSFELKQFSGQRDPRHPLAAGVRGRLSRTQVWRRRHAQAQRCAGTTVIGTIVCFDRFTPQETAALVDNLCQAGIDFIKDEELQSDGPGCPFEDRATEVMRVIARRADRTGHKTMYAFNLTGEIDEMRRRHDIRRTSWGTCVMASLNSVGLSGMIAPGPPHAPADPRA